MARISKLAEMVPESKPAIAPNPSNPGQMQINIEELQKHNIFFATPCYGGQLTDQFFLSMFRLTQALNHYKINYRITTLRNESLVTRARNILTAMFLESDCTHLMFIDSDIKWFPQQILQLLASNKDLVGGIYPKKSYPIEYVVNKIHNGEIENNLIEVGMVGTGFLLIRRTVFEQMIEMGAKKYTDSIGLGNEYDNYTYDFFNCTIDSQDRYLTEDWSFCRRWRQLGGKVWAETSIKLGHVGYHRFEE